jgi:cystathionine beta-lyase
MERETRLVHAGRDPERQEGIVNPPLYRASTILYPTIAAYEGRHERRYTAFAYGIHGTPTVALAGVGEPRAALDPPLVGASGGDLDAHRLRRDDHLRSRTRSGPTACSAPVLARYGVGYLLRSPVGAGIAGLIRRRRGVPRSPGSQTFGSGRSAITAARARSRWSDNTWPRPPLPGVRHGVDVEIQA